MLTFIERQEDLADIFFVVAIIIFVIAAWNAWPERKLFATLVPAGLAVVSAALLVL